MRRSDERWEKSRLEWIATISLWFPCFAIIFCSCDDSNSKLWNLFDTSSWNNLGLTHSATLKFGIYTFARTSEETLNLFIGFQFECSKESDCFYVFVCNLCTSFDTCLFLWSYFLENKFPVVLKEEQFDWLIEVRKWLSFHVTEIHVSLWIFT